MSQAVRSLYLGIIFSVALVGCLVKSGAVKPPKPSGKATLETLAYDSFQNRDRIRAVKLRAVADDIKAGRLKYDGPVMAAVESAGAEASKESWKPVADQLAKLLNAKAGDKGLKGDDRKKFMSGCLKG